jgi:peptidoglycan/xylan/chitin deacetylase (PgdA/CDA1 family)
MANKFIKYHLLPFVFSGPLSLVLEKLATVKIIIPYYHMVSDADVTHTKHLYPHKTKKQFSEDLDYLCKNFHPIQLHDLLAYIKHDQSLPPKALLLTFDDGFREMHDIVAPILRQKGMPATFFVNSSFTDNRNLCYQHQASLIIECLLTRGVSTRTQQMIERLLPRKHQGSTTSLHQRILAISYAHKELTDDIAKLLELDTTDYLQTQRPYLTIKQINHLIADGFTIGAHSIDHPLYSALALDEQLRQTIESVLFVKNTFHLDYGAFAFPHSDLGVTKQYFESIAHTGLVDVSFGTAGLVDDCIPYSFQRLSLERPIIPASDILVTSLVKNLYKSLKHDNKIMRPSVGL